jgi:hypothetical protein
MSRTRALLAAPLAAALLAAPAAAQEPQAPQTSQQRTISVTTTAVLEVQRPERLTERTIRAAVREARERLPAEALRLARRKAVTLAYAAGLQAGELLAVGDPAPSPYGGYGFGDVDGTFGPDRFCGTVTRRTREGRRVSRRTCRFQRQVAQSISVTYAVAPRA